MTSLTKKGFVQNAYKDRLTLKSSDFLIFKNVFIEGCINVERKQKGFSC